MEASILGIVAEWFIPCIDNCSAELYPLVDFCDDVIRALRDLVTDEIITPMVGIPEFKDLFVPANATCSSKNLSCDKEREQRRNDDFVEGDIPPELVIFVAAESRSGKVINVVFEEGDIVFQPDIVEDCDD